jgi:hypothetical protein
MKLRRWLIRIGLIFVLIVVVGVVGFVAWGSTPYPAAPEALAALQNDDTVTVTDAADLIAFVPKNGGATGFVFYPGARVAPAAYAPYLHRIAASGYPAFVVKMPLNFAIFGIDRAQDVIKAHPEIKKWVIGGHSLGGSMAAQAVANRPQAFSGLVFWASYSASDLSKTGIPVLSIFGSEDGLVKKDVAKDSEKFLPPNFQTVTITGGNHAYFGVYGAQDGDKPATISREEASQQIVSATVTFLKQIEQP